MFASNDCPFWTRELRDLADRAPTAAALGAVAVRVLETMLPPVCQLCGPITTGGLGDPERNGLLFGLAIAKLREEGLNPFDQTPLQNTMVWLEECWREQERGRGYPMAIVQGVYEPIFRSGLVRTLYFLPGWETSKGAKWEREEVTRLGLEIREFPQEWYEPLREQVLAVAFS